ncbi:hypothetical protein DQ04_05331000, partial [Trypanosoma grayi]|uniref:hypothetical protein n=1 Tax=Trypanosoma grayi TaxID=71804 RepID=UPI0004F4A597
MPSTGSGYTFEDFLKRMERSPTSHMSPLYHEHRELFVGRPDMFTRAISSVSWEKGCALVDAAYHSQPIAVDTYRALLARMLLHNRHVQRSGAGSLVMWKAAFRTYSEAILSHGNAVPTRMTLSTLRLLAPHRQWEAAVSLLKLSQANEKLTLPMLVDAARCSATPATWPMALDFLSMVHAQAPNMLADSIQSLRPLGTSAATVSAAANAMLVDNSKGPTAEQRHVLSVLNDVVAAVPWKTALSNEMCVSYLTYLAASTTYPSQEKTVALTAVLRQYPWEAFKQLMMRQSVVLPAVSGEATSPPIPEDKKLLHQQQEYKLEASPLNYPAVQESLLLLKSEPETAVPFIAAIVEKLPSAEVSASFLHETADIHRDTRVAAALRHPLVVSALLRKCAEHNEWRLASSVMLSMSPSTIPCDVASTLVLQMRAAKQASLVVEILQKCIVPSRTMLTQEAMEAVLLCVLAHNRAITETASLTFPKTRNTNTTAVIHWRSALSWAVDLLQDDTEGRIVETGSAPSKGAVRHTHTKVIPRLKPMSSRILSLLIHICVNAGSPQGALQAMGYARTVNKTELAMSDEIQALLYCMLYDR